MHHSIHVILYPYSYEKCESLALDNIGHRVFLFQTGSDSFEQGQSKNRIW